MQTNNSGKHVNLFGRMLKTVIAGVLAAICFPTSMLAQTCMDDYKNGDHLKAIQCLSEYIKNDLKNVDALGLKELIVEKIKI